MKTLIWLCLATLCASISSQADDLTSLRQQRDTLSKRGLYRDLVTFYEAKLLPISDEKSGEDLAAVIEALVSLKSISEFDGLMERAISTHAENAHLLENTAQQYTNVLHYGRISDGKFTRNSLNAYSRFEAATDASEPNTGITLNVAYRDYVRALQLYQQASLAAKEDSQRLRIWAAIARVIRSRQAWQMLTLTPLDQLPQWDEPGPQGGTEGASWSGDGPVLFQVPVRWEIAKNDGERWRFALAECARLAPQQAYQLTFEIAAFSEQQFGAATLASYAGWQQQDPENEKGILALEALADDECLAKTSAGVRRFKLTAEHHFIALYRSILDQTSDAGDRLTQIFIERRQFDKACEVLEKTIAKFGAGYEQARPKLLKQITGNWGRFEAAKTVASGTKPKIPLVFRNASNMTLTAAPVAMESVLNDIKAYLKSNPLEPDNSRINPAFIAQRLIAGSGGKYIGKTAVTWQVKLNPSINHRDSRFDLEVPINQSGAWWISGTMENGNAFHTLVWIVDSVMVNKDVAGELQWWLADAKTGAPIANAEIEFFGYRQVDREGRSARQRQVDIQTQSFTRLTDGDGKTRLKPGNWAEDLEWLAVARKEGKASSFFGFQSFSANDPDYDNGNRDLSYGISDRPLYKPGDTVHLKYFCRNVGYFEPDESRWGNKSGQLVVTNGRSEEVIKIQNLKTDALGAMETEFIIPQDAVLGNWSATYRIGDENSTGVVLRVEEFRKPEYEVKVDAPAEPVKLGDSFTATVRANYFHGSPVRNAEVEVIVKRSSINERWFPANRWDWLYGAGAWWTGNEASWHPTWKNWGCIPPLPTWWRGERWTPEEIVLKTHLPIAADGTVAVRIDTATAKAIHGDLDAKYSIEARVVDASRREERGYGSVTVARKPFEIVVWTDRGNPQAGDEIEATIRAATLDSKAVANAKGLLILYQLRVAIDGKIEEQLVQKFAIETTADGECRQKFLTPAIGQYRLAATLSVNGGDSVEGANLLNVHGTGRADPAAWKFGALELTTDKATYAAGETMKLRINSDQPDAHVWLFLHIAGSAGREVRRVQLDGKSLEVEIPLDLRDMPNMFIEAVTVFGAQVYQTTRQVLLPPVSKLIEVTLEPAKLRVNPQEKSSLKIILRDAQGKPVTGQAVLAIYDKSLEAITGGSNIAAMHETFWGWKNNYYRAEALNSIPSSSSNLVEENVPEMASFELNYGSAGGMADGFSDRSGSMKKDGVATRAAPAGRMQLAESPAPVAASAPAIAAQSFVRKDFADLLKWSGSVIVDADGVAEVPLVFPDNLTTWKARVWVLGKDSHVGEGSAEIITSKQLLVRLQAPRFLVERDEAIFSAVVQNDHETTKTARISLELDGDKVTAIDGAAQTREIAAKSEVRIDWRVKALKEGEATVRMRADCGDDGDAVERKIPVRVHGMLRQDAWSRVIEGEQTTAKIEIEVPAERRADQSKLTVQFSPTVAGAVVDAIPYLATYPYGCTEQTLNRFVPAVIAQRMLKDLKIDLTAVKAKRTNLNPQELGNSAERAAQWKQWQTNPVFEESEISKMVKAGVDRLSSMQNSDGGWGWFSGYKESSYSHTTAVVVHGLLTAKANGAKVSDTMLESGIRWLEKFERRETAALQLYVEREDLRKKNKLTANDNRYEKPKTDALDAFVRLVLGEAQKDSPRMLDFLDRDRLELPVYAKCLLGIELHRKGELLRRDEVIKVIGQFLKRDPENQTAFLELGNDGYWWNWYGSSIEAQAWYLKLLVAVQPNSPDTRGLVKYLVNNRKHATYWESTRDTAYAIEAIAAYFKASGENTPNMEVEIMLDGKSLRKVTLNRENIFSFDGRVIVDDERLSSGKHLVELRRSGAGTLYSNAYLEVFTLEDQLRAAGLEVKVSRRISKLITLEKQTQVPDANGLIAVQNVERFRREPLANDAKLASGDRVEVELTLESKNDYEYLLFSDSKAAGFEALDSLSGYVEDGGNLSAYMEPRDLTVNFFVRSLPRGTHTLRYQLRAETPGIYKALPTQVEAMYAPELRANSDDLRLEITQ